MADPSSTVPGYGTGKNVSGQREAGTAYSGERLSGDPTNEPGQYPPGDWSTAFFGGALPDGTGAPGSAGGAGAGDDPTVEAGQTVAGWAGVTSSDVTDTGAPGTAGGDPSDGTGADAVTFTRPGSYLSGTYASDSVRDDVDGPSDWTQANDSGYGTAGPKLPGMAEPKAGEGPFQPGGGRVLRGGRAVHG